MASIGYGYGSEWHLVQHLARRRHAFTERVEALTGLSAVTWLDSEEHSVRGDPKPRIREMRGLDFLHDQDPVRLEWESLWPQSGNVHNWDAVGRASTSGCWLLLEAKAHVGELQSSCSAKDATSRARIKSVLDQCKVDLGVVSTADWTTDYYQYCNRVALLNFLSNRRIDARLVFVYFVGDRPELGSPGRECPASEDEWREPLENQKAHAAIPPAAPICQRIHSVFLPAYRTSVNADVLKPQYCRITT